MPLRTADSRKCTHDNDSYVTESDNHELAIHCSAAISGQRYLCF